MQTIAMRMRSEVPPERLWAVMRRTFMGILHCIKDELEGRAG
ncbi:MAG: hypothetical protein OXT09_31130 [Myxococcales bacterium]|nr:hypothetical protein [Myxococcales bacterium]